MKSITVSLITEKKEELNRFLSKYYNREMNIKKETFKWSLICNSPLECLSLITTVIDNNNQYNMQVVVSMPELSGIINDDNINQFVKYLYIYHRKN